MKRIGILICALGVLLSACAAPAAEPERMETEGRLLLAENDSALLVTEDGMPMVLSVQEDGNDPWAGYHSGDWAGTSAGTYTPQRQSPRPWKIQ